MIQNRLLSMDLTIATMLFWILFSCLTPAEARIISSRLTVPNGACWGAWGLPDYCSWGHAYGFSLKVLEPQGSKDDSALNGIRLHCSDGKVIESAVGRWGTWTEVQYCPKTRRNKQTYLVAFTLRVEAPGSGDETAANNIQFKCSDGTILTGNGGYWGGYGPWSSDCKSGFIYGLETRIHCTYFYRDNTGLNDVKFICGPEP